MPSRAEVVKQAPREERNFLALNARAAVTSAHPRIVTVDPAEAEPKHADYGAVPEYLRARKEAAYAAEAEARRAAKESEGCPRGHRVMPDSERLETLSLLKKSMDEASDALRKMPFTSDVPSSIKRRAELEAKVKKMEDAITVFSRPKVFVKIDA